MKTIRTAAFASIAGLSIAASAYADNRPTMASVCKNIPCVYDAHGTVVGIPANSYQVLRQISGIWYIFAVNQSGPQDDVIFYYTTANCAGQKYMEYVNQMMPVALYDGQSQSTWVQVPNSVIIADWHSYAYGNPLYCVTYDSPGDAYLQATAKGETHTFVAPLQVK